MGVSCSCLPDFTLNGDGRGPDGCSAPAAYDAWTGDDGKWTSNNSWSLSREPCGAENVVFTNVRMSSVFFVLDSKIGLDLISMHSNVRKLETLEISSR